MIETKKEKTFPLSFFFLKRGLLIFSNVLFTKIIYIYIHFFFSIFWICQNGFKELI